MPTTITRCRTIDIRFPTSRELDGSDAMNPDPDYSAAYVVLETNVPGLTGHGLTFTIGRGNEIVCAAVKALEYLVVGHTLEEFAASPGKFWHHLTGDSQLRWIGPEKGAIHLATAALVNALWDLHAKARQQPLWRLLCGLSPDQLVDCIDFRYLTDALTPEEARDLLRRREREKPQRIAELERDGYPAYTTSAGWLGYPDDKIRQLCREGIAGGWNHFKIKVGRDLADDIRRCRIMRDEIGWERKLMVDANQFWDVPQAIAWMKELAQFKPWWIEEPTSPDDVLGHATIARALEPLGIGVATGEHGMNRVLFKQLLQARAISFCQIDSCRLGGVNEVLAVYLLAAKFGVPVCPHAGGVGLCEYVQHLQMWDYVCVTGSTENRLVEFVDHLHEHFVDPCVVKNGHYLPPTRPGYSIEMKPASIADHTFPGGKAWRKT
jgi:L-fuconate dehydratase